MFVGGSSFTDSGGSSSCMDGFGFGLASVSVILILVLQSKSWSCSTTLARALQLNNLTWFLGLLS